MKHLLFSDDISLSERWNYILIGKKREIIDDIEILNKVENSVIVFNYSKDEAKCESLITTLISNKNILIVLDRIPDFKKALKYLSLGIKGYGNVIMSRSYLISAVESVIKEQIWLSPDISARIVKEVASNANSKHNEKTAEEVQSTIYNNLTKTEEKIAVLIKDGFTNTEISEKLNISVNTTKTHIKNIYKKLDVNDRLSFSVLFTKSK